jgi:gp16 family phage-associated protein
MKQKNPDEIREDFIRRGQAISDWARDRGFTPNLVYLVLGGKRRALRGQSHNIAVALGIKNASSRSRKAA